MPYTSARRDQEARRRDWRSARMAGKESSWSRIRASTRVSRSSAHPWNRGRRGYDVPEKLAPTRRDRRSGTRCCSARPTPRRGRRRRSRSEVARPSTRQNRRPQRIAVDKNGPVAPRTIADRDEATSPRACTARRCPRGRRRALQRGLGTTLNGRRSTTSGLQEPKTFPPLQLPRLLGRGGRVHRGPSSDIVTARYRAIAVRPCRQDDFRT